jgi:uncharacterized protein
MKESILTLCCLLMMATASFSQKEVPADSTYHLENNVVIPTKSGVGISAIIARKKSNTKPLPVVLFYTTYHQGEGDAQFAKWPADRDYVGVVAYTRGIRTDVEEYTPYEHEQEDIYDILEWISKQEWCNGSIGMFGGSYTGFSQWSAVKNIHPALKTIVPQVAVMPGFDFPMQNNVPLGFELNWAHTNILGKEPIPGGHLWEWYEKGYAYAKMDSALGYTNTYFQKWLQHPAYDTYWKSLIPTAEEYAAIDIPVLTTTGYFDGPQISAVEYFTLHNKHNKNAEHYLVIGPYDHWGGQANPAPTLRGYAIDSVANISMRGLAFEWLDWVLKGAPKPVLLKDKVNFQVMGTNTWQHAPSIEAMSDRTLRLYLKYEKLTPEKPEAHSFQKQTIDFTDRETMNNYFHPNLIIDSLDASNGRVFTSAVFEESITINGAFTGQLVVETNKRDMDVSLSFYQQTPQGNYFLLSRYLGRASYAKDPEQRMLLTPGKKEQIPLNASHIISKKLEKGSRLVMVLNVNKHPFEILNYGSGKEPSQETMDDAGEPMMIKWWSESYIEVPVGKE